MESVEDGLVLFMDRVTALAAALRCAGQQAGGLRGLSFSQRAALMLVEEAPGLTVPQLARLRGHSRQSIQALMDRMAEMGWVEYVANPDHRRSERLQLTPGGRRTLNTANRGLAAWVADLSPHLTREQLQSCIGVMERLEQKLGGKPQLRTQPGPGVRRVRPRPQVAATASFPAAVAEPVVEELPDDSSLEEFPVNLL